MYRTSAAADRSILVSAFSGQIFGLHRSTGAVAWSAEIEGYGGEVEVAIEGDVVIACTRSRLALFDYLTGRTIAYVHLVGEHARRPTMVVDQGQIIVARNGEVACYATNGDAVWLQKFEGMGFGSVTLGLPGNVRQGDDVGSK
ncbi:MAG: PQQ-binding-like beta-propeller repeat protein [Deltaproteobacteria bacterium]|nr:PQQ-binding-like beta-propeller repeat protein [Myxococcales bacterium]MDP3215028.1 PQQ-binding-like beta-propeller repeat protein [Deltaproteobacteria bacterium]